jgi:hypothetical protein
MMARRPFLVGRFRAMTTTLTVALNQVLKPKIPDL